MIDKSIILPIRFAGRHLMDHPPPCPPVALSKYSITPAALRTAIEQLGGGDSLNRDEAYRAFRDLMSGSASPEEIAGLLFGLRVKGETADEVAGAVMALRESMVRVDAPDPDGLVDTAGTGGGIVGTFNISTLAALVTAGAGARVAKHGNRSATSKCGSADVLEALGVEIVLPPALAAEVLDEIGFTFLYAPYYHPAMRHVAPVRRALGVTTVMNMVGPLVNPAGAGRQVMGVSDLSRCGVIAETFARLGVVHALVVHADVGMDEISPAGRTAIWEVRGGEIERWTLDPASFGEDSADISGIGGGDPVVNAQRVHAVLDGEADRSARCAVLLNAAAAIYVALDLPFDQALDRARDSLDTGKARKVLDRLRARLPRKPGQSESGSQYLRITPTTTP